MSDRTPYRVIVFGHKYMPVKRLKRSTRIELRGFAYCLWTETQHYDEARLPSAGSFLFPGLHRVREAAMQALTLPGIDQVSVRTNQDRKVFQYFKHADGTITGYMPDNDIY